MSGHRLGRARKDATLLQPAAALRYCIFCSVPNLFQAERLRDHLVDQLLEIVRSLRLCDIARHHQNRSLWTFLGGPEHQRTMHTLAYHTVIFDYQNSFHIFSILPILTVNAVSVASIPARRRHCVPGIGPSLPGAASTAAEGTTIFGQGFSSGLVNKTLTFAAFAGT